MDIAQVAETAEGFLQDYLEKNSHFTPDAEIDVDDPATLRIFFFRAVPHPSLPDTIMYMFVFGRKLRKEDPEVTQRVEQSMAALKQAHPEVNQFKAHLNVKRATGA
ncbi:hypothetical protein [Hyalangium rubrum]|uniref:Uncharacterized protein n=1 Tax=Hyalangium rubrum TaxID=3103134 RepID=A0ABU5HCU4_9BACT|nr:hypothetical protein [Hyalangium sp. s54d21]MDY7231161.1 hypothetical protein [Hyalangium sp. s54d21]